MKRLLLKCAVLSFLCTTGMAQTTTVFNAWHTTDYDPFYDQGVLYGLSSNGYYATGFSENTQVGLLWSKEGNQLTDIYSTAAETTEHEEATAYDVSDKGTVVGSYWGITYKDKANRYCIYPGYRTIDGVWHDIELLSNTVTGRGLAGAIIRVSKDDQIMGGHILNEDGSLTVPAIWKNGVLQKPIVEIPDCKIFNMTAMSEDGKVWGGIKLQNSMITSSTSYDAIIYNDGTLISIPYDGYPENASAIRTYVSGISENGKYVCGYGYYTADNKIISKGFIYNTTESEFTWIEGIAPSTVTNDGTLYGRSFIDNTLGSDKKIATALIYKNGELNNLKEYLISIYKLAIDPENDFEMSDVTGVSEIQNDAFTIVGNTVKAGGMLGMERLSTPFVICISQDGNITSDIGTTIESDKIKITLFDGKITNSSTFNYISPNNRYLIGGIVGAYAYVYDREAGNIRKITGPDYIDDEGKVAQLCNGNTISNEGVIGGNFVCKDSIDPKTGEACAVAGIYKNGKWIALDRLPNVPLAANGYDGSVSAISADGSIIAGRVAPKLFKYNAAKWSADGKITKLLGGCERGDGGAIKSMSADGRVACGWVEGSEYGYTAIWVDDDVILIGKEEDADGTAFSVSPNGKYVSGYYRNDPDNMPLRNGFVYNTETKELKIVKGHEKATGVCVIGTSDDGKTIVGYSMFGRDMTSRKPFIIIKGEFYDLDEYLKLAECTFPSQYSDLSLFTPIGISGDGKIIYGMADNGYRLPWVLEIKETPRKPKTVYGFVNGNENNKTGMASFDLSAPAEVNIYKKSDAIVVAGAYANKEYYQVRLSASTPWGGWEPEYPNLVTVNIETGEETQKGNVMLELLDMSYDYSTNKMYAIAYNEDYSGQDLVTLDLNDGSSEKIASLSGASLYLTLACNLKGELFTIADDGNLYSIDKKNGEINVIGATGLMPVNFLNQDMEFDHETNTLYWVAVSESAFNASLTEVDTQTGTADLVGRFTNNDQIVGLYIPAEIIPSGIYDETCDKANINISLSIANDYLYIQGDYTSVSVYNTAGACILTDTQKSGSVNIAGLSQGVYYVKVANDNQSASFKIFKR